MNDNTTLLTIDADYQLAEAKLIAEPWDAGGLYQLGAISGSKWREWNGQFRDDVRSFMRGDCGKVKNFILRLLGSPDIYNEHEVDPQKSINFVTCHDGFTLYDLVCYSEKHNFANGENNNDGNNANYSANYGIEGPSDDKSLKKLRLRQAKNFMAITMLSYGTPMICMGDEVLRSQKGNNNAYCQDNELSYLKWEYNEDQKNMLSYTQRLIELRRQGQLSPHGNDNYNNKLDNALKNAKIQWHGTKPFQPDWSDMSHSVGFLFRHKTADVYAYVYVNAFWEDLTIELPSVPGHLHRNWYQYLNTALQTGKEVSNFYMSRRYRAGDKIKVKNHSILMLICPAT
jgi:glycogen operon protein